MSGIMGAGPGAAFLRVILAAAMLASVLLSGFSAQAADEVIYPQPVQITVEENGEYKIVFEGDLEPNERWAWFVCPDADSAEDLLGVMQDAVAYETPVRSLTFTAAFQAWPTHGTSGIPTVRVPAGSGYVF